MSFDKVCVLILNFIVNIFVANYYGNYSYGSFQYALSVVTVFGVLIEFNNSRVIKKRFVLDNPGELVWNTTVSSAFFSLSTIIIGFFYAFICRDSFEFKAIFLVLLFNSAILGFRYSMQSRFEFELLSREVIIAGNISNLIAGFLQIIAVILKKPIIYLAFIGSVSAIINVVILYLLYKKRFGKLFFGKIRIGLIKSVIVESLPLTIGAACTIIYSKCDSIMIGNMISKGDVGVYTIALSFINVTLIAINPIRDSYYPKLVELYNKKESNEYINHYLHITSILTWLSIVGIVFSYFVLPFVIKLYKPEYIKALPIFCVYSINVLFMYNAGLRAGHFTLINKGKVLMYSQVICISVNCLLNFVFIKYLGVYGAAIATGITQFISLYLSNFLWGKDGRDVLKWQVKSINPKYIFVKEV